MLEKAFLKGKLSNIIENDLSDFTKYFYSQQQDFSFSIFLLMFCNV